VQQRAAVDVVRSAVATLNAGDIVGYLEHFEPGCPRWAAGLEQPLSLRDIADNLDELHAGFDDLHLHEELLFGDAVHACARWRLAGRHVRPCYGLEPTGAAIDVPTCELYEVVDGVIGTVWVYGDPGGLFDQIRAHGEAHR
jgi:hypothetical protein